MGKINYNNEDLADHHGVSAVIRNNKGQILMQEHVKYGFWTIPVGKVKTNQETMDGLKEEIFEETNLIVKDCKEIKFKVYECQECGSNHAIYGVAFLSIQNTSAFSNHTPQRFLIFDGHQEP